MRDSTFSLRVLLLVAIGLAAWLVRPFADAVIVAAVVSILAWPLHLRVLARLGGRALPATAISLMLVTVGVLVPGAGLAWVVSRELAALAEQLVLALDQGDLSTMLGDVQRLPLVSWLVSQAGGEAVIIAEVRGALRELVGELARNAGQSVPGLVGLTARALLKVLVFFLTLASILHRGRELVPWAVRVSPLMPAHSRRLFQVFSEFARNVVLAGLVAAAVQSVIAGVGYLLAGVERPLLFALLTGVLAYVPLVGTAAAWAPVSLLLLLQGRPGAALFVVLWSILLTGTVDNLIKPLVVRGKSELPTVLVFLGVFGGLLTFGLIGLLVGPVIMAIMMALLHIWDESRTLDPTSAAAPATGAVPAE